MKTNSSGALATLLGTQESQILTEWVRNQQAAPSYRPDLIRENELADQSRRFLRLFADALTRGASSDINANEWTATRELLDELSQSRAQQGFSPSETATFVFSLKQPVFASLREAVGKDVQKLGDAFWDMSEVIDQLGLYTTETYQRSREHVIARQQHELLELSTPVVQLWDDVLALPLVGTLDSARAQVVMETLLQRIVETEAAIAIIDITGVPTVDTLVAQHLMKTIAATRLMGADCIISGIRPQIAQTIVHLGVDLGEVTTKATLADAFAVALKRTGAQVVPVAPRA